MAKRRKDQKIKTSEGIIRVKPIKNVGTDPETGKSIQNVAVKRADGSITTTRYADGEQIGQTYQPKKMRKKRVKKLKVKRKPRKLKKVAVPAYEAPEVTVDKEMEAELARREDVKKKKQEKEARIEARKKGRVKRKVRRVAKNVGDTLKTSARRVKRKITRGPRARKVKNLVTGGTNILR